MELLVANRSLSRQMLKPIAYFNSKKRSQNVSSFVRRFFLTLVSKLCALNHVVLGAVVEDRILDRAQVADLAQMPPKDSLLGEIVALLNMPSQKMSQLLNHNQQSLSQNLSQYVKDQGKETE